MNELVIETSGLSKRYGTRLAVDRLDLRVRKGEVYGLVGPNGAGKTTTLKLLVGLIKPTSGSAVVLDEPPGSPAGLERIGALIESPTFYPYLSARDNLKVLARHGHVPEQRVLQVLAQVDLDQRIDDAFSTYSTGMKQRLGVAAALLKDPVLLILDEPTSGLDPAGIVEMRSFIQSLGRGDRAVILSSHLMSEVEQICDRVGVIVRGKLVREGTIEELAGEPHLRIRAQPTDEAARICELFPGVRGVKLTNDALQVTIDPIESARLNESLVKGGVEVSELVQVRHSLEEIFLRLTAGEEARSV
jgi:ABC-2 type transport system ATP-binding protein